MNKNKNNKDCRNLSLDCESFHNENFNDTDFTGANLSESIFHACDFTGAIFTGTCITDTKFIKSIFDANALLSLTAFNCSFEECVCIVGTQHLTFDAPPIVLSGLHTPIALIGQMILVGSTARKYAAWLWYLGSNSEKTICDIPREIFEKVLSLLLLCGAQKHSQKDIYLRTVAYAQ